MQFAETPPVKEFEIRTIVALLRRQMRVIAYSGVVIFALAGLFLLIVTPTYTATSLILIDPDKKNLLNPGAPYPGTSGRDNARVDSEVEILRSDAVALSVITDESLNADPEYGAQIGFSQRLSRAVGIANAAVRDHPQLTAKTLARFKDATSIRRRGLTYLISVSVSSRSPARAAELSNKMADAYIRQQVQAKITASLTARDVLQEQITSSRMALSGYETAFDRFVATNIGAIGAGDGRGGVADLRTRLQKADQALQTKEHEHTNALRLMQRQDWAGLAAALGDETLGQLGRDRQALLNQITSPPTGANPLNTHQALIDMDTELGLQSSRTIQGISTQLQTLNQSTANLRGQLRRSVLDSDLSPKMLAEIYALQQDAGIARTQYQNLLTNMRDLETQARIQIADSRVVSPAIEPTTPGFPNRNLVLLAALAASMGIGVSLAFMNEYYIGGVTSTTQLGEVLGTPAAATIPLSPARGQGQFSIAETIIDAPLSIYSESIRKLRATIDQGFTPRQPPLQGAGPHRGKIILFTSALPGEGKTTTALALARTYALSGRKTLLIDADLRRPSVHHHLGLVPQAGFLDYLQNPSGKGLSGSFYARDPASTLALIMGAERSEVPTDQLLGSATFETLLGQARDIYDVIVIDSPPLLPVVDARYIARYADAVVMLVKWASTSQSDLRTALLPLRAAMAPSAVLLPVLAQVHTKTRRSEYSAYGDGYSAAI